MLYISGSSPRVRGTRAYVYAFQALIRFIPACAGNTNFLRRRGRGISVHPRVCGEHPCQESLARLYFGSSPRVRGTLFPCHIRHICCRFIPACAGNTLYIGGRNKAGAVHPRVCGEHPRMVKAFAPQFGSSPRVRGTPPYYASGKITNRFIPACAGNTF